MRDEVTEIVALSDCIIRLCAPTIGRNPTIETYDDVIKEVKAAIARLASRISVNTPADPA